MSDSTARQDGPVRKEVGNDVKVKFFVGRRQHCDERNQKLMVQVSHDCLDAGRSVSRILHHIHPCLIYEAIMRHIRDKYKAIMKQISIIFSKNEVVGAVIFVYCQTTINL